MADYFSEFSKNIECLTPELAVFLNNGSGPLNWSYNQLNQRIGDLRWAVLVNQKLSLERYQTALAGMTFSYLNGPFSLTEIPNEQMKIILDLGIVPVTVSNVAVIRENYPIVE